MTREYERALGRRLREIRVEQKMSLRVVEEKSEGQWKAVVLGSYERGDRAVTAVGLAGLAEFYGLPIAELLPDNPVRHGMSARTMLLDLTRLSEMPADQGGPLARFAAAIQSDRGDYNGKVLSIRLDDLRALAVMYEMTPEQLTEKLVAWGVLPDDADSE